MLGAVRPDRADGGTHSPAPGPLWTRGMRVPSIPVPRQDLLFVCRACWLPRCVLVGHDAWEVLAKGSSSKNILDVPSRSTSHMPRYFCGTSLPPSCPVGFLWRLAAGYHWTTWSSDIMVQPCWLPSHWLFLAQVWLWQGLSWTALRERHGPAQIGCSFWGERVTVCRQKLSCAAGCWGGGTVLSVCASPEGPLLGPGGWPGRCHAGTFPWWSSTWAAVCQQCGPTAGRGRGLACTRRGVHPSACCSPVCIPR